MKVQGREYASWGFRIPTDGWHTVCFSEGINLKINESTGKESLYIPFAINEGSEDDGIKGGSFINTLDENRTPYKQVEQQIADVVLNAGLADGFEKAFPGDVSFLNPKVIEMIKIKLPGCYCDVELNTKKDKNDKDRTNVITWAKVGTKYGKTKVTSKKEKVDPQANLDGGGKW
jgi:hypothetical protein